MLELLAAGKTVTEIAAEAGVTRGVARHLKKTGGVSGRRGRPPFFEPEEEKLLFQCERAQALIGRGLTRDAFLSHCEKYILTLSKSRKDQAKTCFGGKTKPSKTFFELFMHRWPVLKRYRVGMLEQSRAENSRPDVAAKWFAGLELCYRDLDIQHGRQIIIRDETHVRARDLLIEDQTSIVGTRDMDKPELVSPSIGSAASRCTVAFTVPPSGIVAPYFCIVEGSSDGHAYVVVKEGGTSRYMPLVERLNDGAIVRRRQPAGLTKELLDALEKQLAV